MQDIHQKPQRSFPYFYLWLLFNFFLHRLKLEFCLIMTIAQNREETQEYLHINSCLLLFFLLAFVVYHFLISTYLRVYWFYFLSNALWMPEWVHFSMALVKCSLCYIGLSSLEISIYTACFVNHLLWNIDSYLSSFSSLLSHRIYVWFSLLCSLVSRSMPMMFGNSCDLFVNFNRKNYELCS